MSELRRLEFSTAGSLLADVDNELLPAVGGALSIPANEIQRYGKGHGNAGPFFTATQFITYQYHILSETCRLPTANATLKSIMSELFALDSISKQMPNFLNLRWDKGPFVLAHQDLRHSNIIIDEEFRIQGIIDWEFTGPIPRQLFTPPSWITGHDCDGMTTESQRNSLSADFYMVLERASKTCLNAARLKEDWDAQQTVSLAVAQILRRPSCLEAVYYKFIFPTLFHADADQVISDACHTSSLLAEAEGLLEESKRYTQYLNERGLLNEHDSIMKEFLEKAAALRKRLDAMNNVPFGA
ncbi:hypothetical protein ED733_001932 [Metarhizium rileyi]|uniref:Aminoglycoside phosphotransferase domain-containing protein n=1 Tax=Metarhizium rileyi (strain RCEF 4871) TaxID=1649241 RepID=A0A5C6G4F3_METRR|nr:hypothetical protein ED733_001932 [Metarhizium rileyi]